MAGFGDDSSGMMISRGGTGPGAEGVGSGSAEACAGDPVGCAATEGARGVVASRLVEELDCLPEPCGTPRCTSKGAAEFVARSSTTFEVSRVLARCEIVAASWLEAAR